MAGGTSRNFSILVLAAALSCAAAVARAAPPRLSSAFELGYDRFAQVFKIADSILLDSLGPSATFRSSSKDTTDVFTEFRTQGELRLRNPKGAHRYDLLLLGSLGTSLNRGTFDAVYRYRPRESATRWDLEAKLEGRQFVKDSSFSLSHDNLRALTSVRWRRRASHSVEFGLKLKDEDLRYDGRSEFEYDQNRWTGSGLLSLDRGLGLTLDLEAGGGVRTVPDSTQISYQRGFLNADLLWLFGAGHSLSCFSTFERRAFQDPKTRSPYWDLVLEPQLRIMLTPLWRLSLDLSQELLFYDTDGQVYQDTWIGELGIGLTRRFGELELGVQPRWSWDSSPRFADDEYRQPSVLVKADLYGNGRLWFTISEEIGRRLYADSPEASIQLYTDYTFFRTTLMATLSVSEKLSLNAFVSDQPDNHLREEDDSRLTLYSLSLRASF
ncbi:MAG TPA: hypothetical protein VKA63_08940 [Candidatus Krumholzibacteria bacterium]|nr:hypothetical protein [Candidatus Krumholzibacteria bacterium]